MPPFGGMKKAEADRVWKALSDATRREILDLLAETPRVTGDLIEHFEDLSRSMVMKHLDILVAAGLVTVRREGRFRWNTINPVPIQQVCERWVHRHVAPLASSMLRLKQHVEGGEAHGKSRETKESEE